MISILHHFLRIIKRIGKQPKVSCKAYIAYDLNTEEILIKKNEFKLNQAASMTKMATLLTALDLIQEQDLEDMITVSKQGADIKNGTHADLKAGEKYKLLDLLYGMMLPSGNDAAHTIAEYLSEKYNLEESSEEYNEIDGSYYFYNPNNKQCRVKYSRDHPAQKFVNQMNKYVKSIGCKNTYFVNVHGMHGQGHYSCAYDMLKISLSIIKNELASKIVNTRYYETIIENKFTAKITKKWENSNILLQCKGRKYEGIKTGWIPDLEGDQKLHCTLSSLCNIKNSKLVIVIMGSVAKELRFVDTENIANYCEFVL